MSVISMGLIRNIQVQVCNIANDTAFGDTQYICTRYPNFSFSSTIHADTSKNIIVNCSCEAANLISHQLTKPLVNYCDLLLHDLELVTVYSR